MTIVAEGARLIVDGEPVAEIASWNLNVESCIREVYDRDWREPYVIGERDATIVVDWSNGRSYSVEVRAEDIEWDPAQPEDLRMSDTAYCEMMQNIQESIIDRPRRGVSAQFYREAMDAIRSGTTERLNVPAEIINPESTNSSPNTSPPTVTDDQDRPDEETQFILDVCDRVTSHVDVLVVMSQQRDVDRVRGRISQELLNRGVHSDTIVRLDRRLQIGGQTIRFATVETVHRERRGINSTEMWHPRALERDSDPDDSNTQQPVATVPNALQQSGMLTDAQVAALRRQVEEMHLNETRRAYMRDAAYASVTAVSRRVSDQVSAYGLVAASPAQLARTLEALGRALQDKLINVNEFQRAIGCQELPQSPPARRSAEQIIALAMQQSVPDNLPDDKPPTRRRLIAAHPHGNHVAGNHAKKQAVQAD